MRRWQVNPRGHLVSTAGRCYLSQCTRFVQCVVKGPISHGVSSRYGAVGDVSSSNNRDALVVVEVSLSSRKQSSHVIGNKTPACEARSVSRPVVETSTQWGNDGEGEA